MSLPEDCIQFLATCNLQHYENFFFDLGVSGLEDFNDVEKSDLKKHLKPLEERRFFKALCGKTSAAKEKHEEARIDNNEEINKCKLLNSPFGKAVPIYLNAAEKGIKLWSDFQIKSAVGLEKKRREFFNAKADQLCAFKDIKKNWTKTEIIGAVDTAWVLKKTALLQVETRYTETLTKEKKIKNQKESTVIKNQNEMLQNHQKLLCCNAEIEKLKKENSKTDTKESEMMCIMRRLKNAQEALRKCLQDRLVKSGEEATKINKDFEEMPLSVELTDFLGKTVKEHEKDSDSDEEPACKRMKNYH